MSILESKEKIVGYCMRCKTKKEIKDIQEVVMKNGRSAVRGVCATCGTKMFKIIGKINEGK